MKRILIIEDDNNVARALELRIRSACYSTTVASDGYSGVASVARSRPDLVLLDINMPGGNGFTVAERIRAIAPDKIPIVFITASKQREFFERAMALGASGYIEKPYDPVQVLTLLANVLDKPALRPTDASRPDTEPRAYRLD